MKVSRDIATPLTIGVFFLMSITGILMFFHADVGLNKLAHEWFGWIMILGVGLHTTVNWLSFKNYFLKNKTARIVLVISTILIACSFISIPKDGIDKSGPPHLLPLRAVLEAPIEKVAPLTKYTPEQLIERLNDAGIEVHDTNQTLSKFTKGSKAKDIAVLKALFE